MPGLLPGPSSHVTALPILTLGVPKTILPDPLSAPSPGRGRDGCGVTGGGVGGGAMAPYPSVPKVCTLKKKSSRKLPGRALMMPLRAAA